MISKGEKIKPFIVTVLLLLSIMLMAGCGGNSDSAAQTYTVILTGIQMQKKGGVDELTIDGLPIDGATITRE